MELTPFYEELLPSVDIKLDLTEKKLECSEQFHYDVVKRVIDFYIRLKHDEKIVDAIWKPSGEWKNYNDEKSFFYSLLLERKVDEANFVLRNFWRNGLGLIVKEYAKFDLLQQNNRDVVESFIRSNARNYLIWKDMYGLSTKKLELKNLIGNPWGCKIDNILVAPKAIRYQNNSMQLNNLLQAAGGNCIAEIGGGYGGLCHYLLQENSNIKYIDFDLAETLVLSAYYLLLNFPEKKICLYGENKFTTDLENQYDIMLLPNYIISEFTDKSIDVFFNSFSLSEMPIEVNKEYINQIARLTKSFFLHNNMDRKGVINRGFERIPGSEYPIDPDFFISLYKNYDMFHSHNGDYKEFLYKLR